MENKIVKIEPQSIAEEMGIEVGDSLISINGKEVKDIIDYRFLMADEYVVVKIQKTNKEIWELEIEKEYDEKLGVEFESGILDSAKSCRNKCIFCFIDQLPKGMRKTLYFKDDDSRLSFLQGNFVTLTNMSDDDIDRIIKYRISPINISVQTTNPELRKKMLNNKFAGNLMERMEKLSNAGITMNCQVVLCPGINSGEEFSKTVNDLYKLYPSVKNIAGVPVGITSYREGLFNMVPYDAESASKEIENIKPIQEKFIKEIGSPFVRLSDEFYVLSGIPIPKAEFYGEFEQFEDGIGMIRTFRDNINMSLDNLKTDIHKSFTMVTGVLAYEEIENAAKMLMAKSGGLKINVIKVINEFFGEKITVAGLLTGRDILNYLKRNEVGDYIILPSNMLKSDEDVFLDDVKVSDIEKELNKKVLVCNYSGEDLVDIINKNGREE
ncbi:Fe-S oxidoreductase [Clostridium acetobutylicum]|nr:Fe-S oxidoreductase [Clostridium acetobutylicum]